MTLCARNKMDHRVKTKVNNENKLIKKAKRNKDKKTKNKAKREVRWLKPSIARRQLDRISLITSDDFKEVDFIREILERIISLGLDYNRSMSYLSFKLNIINVINLLEALALRRGNPPPVGLEKFDMNYANKVLYLDTKSFEDYSQDKVETGIWNEMIALNESRENLNDY